jgi:fructose-specific component phosphotransferase system IIB-like protein
MYSEVSLVFNNKKNSDNRLDNKAAIVKGAAQAVSAPGEFASKAAPIDYVAGSFRWSPEATFSTSGASQESRTHSWGS